MQLLSVFLLSLSANIDSFTVGLSYGIKGIKVDYKSNLLIALITSIGTFLSMGLGLFIKRFLPVEILGITGCIILIFIGLFMVVNSFKNKSEILEESDVTYTDILNKPQKADKDKSGCIDLREAITLGCALSLNNFGLGIGASATGINIYLTTFFTFTLSIICIVLGVGLGERCMSKVFKKYADLISGMIILCLGIYELF